MAGDTTALANPVIGTTVPAPAKLAILSYTPIPVNNAPKKTIIIGSHIFASYSEMPKNFNSSKIPCPMVHIAPPIRNAIMIFFIYFGFGLAS